MMEPEPSFEDFKLDNPALECKKVAIMNVEDDRFNYEFVDKDYLVRKNKYDELIDPSKLDYDIPTNNEKIEPLPLSFFQIEEGDIVNGTLWYLNKFPKLPIELAQLLARYNWGDLKYATKKSLRNGRKKYQKKNKGTKPPIAIKINRVPILLKWN